VAARVRPQRRDNLLIQIGRQVHHTPSAGSRRPSGAADYPIGRRTGERSASSPPARRNPRNHRPSKPLTFGRVAAPTIGRRWRVMLLPPAASSLTTFQLGLHGKEG